MQYIQYPYNPLYANFGPNNVETFNRFPVQLNQFPANLNQFNHTFLQNENLSCQNAQMYNFHAQLNLVNH